MQKELKIRAGAIVYTQGADTTVLDVQGTGGQLFSVNDSNLGLLMFVADISGERYLEVYDDNTVVVFGTIEQERSLSETDSVRRDELYLNYQEDVEAVGIVNNLVIGEGTKTIRFTLATNLTGVDPSTAENCRKIIIYNDNSVGALRIEHEDAGSTDVNRFDIGSDFDIPYKTWKSFIYIGGRWRIEA
jgi:hypothetical protein